VDLKEHQGFRGGLPADGSTGVVAPYWASERFELIYHVVTFMPTSSFLHSKTAETETETETKRNKKRLLFYYFE
jgi:hypothetical protein